MLGPWIVLTTDRKPYPGNPMVLSGHARLNGTIPRQSNGAVRSCKTQWAYKMEIVHVRSMKCIDNRWKLYPGNPGNGVQ